MEIGLDEKYVLATYLRLEKDKLFIAESMLKVKDSGVLSKSEWNELIQYIRECNKL